MSRRLRAFALTIAALISQPSIAGEAVPINATFGIGWTPVDWSDPADRITESLGAAQLPGGITVGIATRDHLNTLTGSPLVIHAEPGAAFTALLQRLGWRPDSPVARRIISSSSP